VSKHSAMHLGVMLDWIRTCQDDGTVMPTNAEICERFNLQTDELARSLLADLADAGKIRINWGKEGRILSLGRAASPAAESLRAEPTVKRAGARVPGPSASRALISDIARRLQAAPPPATTIPAEPSPPKEAPMSRPLAAAAAKPAHAAKPAAPVYPAHRSPPGVKRMINVRVEGALLTAIEDQAEVEKTALGRVALDMLERGFAAANVPPVPDAEPIPLGKPLIRAAVLRAWRADGGEFAAFLTRLLDLGLDQWNNQTIGIAE
jgi:hypothetical protein